MDRCDWRPLRGVGWCIALFAFAIAFVAPALSFEGPPQESQEEPIVALLAKVIPTVVAIHTRRDLSTEDTTPKAAFAPKIQRAEGSGFVVSPDGFIATNKHVVHGAYDVAVSLHDGRTVKAKIVWESAVVDVAFLKIETDRPLQAAVLSRDSTLQIGRRVVAVGNPLGLGISASAGIVSAVDRNLKQTPYDSYIQTDAAINSGNSGGPLFDLSGEVVGMNSILWTVGKDQGSQGLGFAIPSADISFLIDQLKRTGRIACGTIGVNGERLTAAMADAVGFHGTYGVIVASMDSPSSAAQAGLRLGDIIESLDGKPLYDLTTLNRATCLSLGRIAELKVWRESRPITLRVRVEEAANGPADTSQKAAVMAPRFASAQDLGMTLAPVDAAARRKYDLGADVHGFVVTNVVDSSEADNASLEVGDVIVSLQMLPLTGTEPFDGIFADEGRKGHHHVILLVKATGGDRWITFPVRLAGSP